MSKDIQAIKDLSDIREIIDKYMDGLSTESEAVKLIRDKTENYMTPQEEDAFVKDHEQQAQDHQEFSEQAFQERQKGRFNTMAGVQAAQEDLKVT